VYLTKSDFKVAQTCPTKLYYKKCGYRSLKDDDEYLALLAEGGFIVQKIATLLYPEGAEMTFSAGPTDAARDTLRMLEAQNATLFEATLISGNKLARVDILRKLGNEFHLIAHRRMKHALPKSNHFTTAKPAHAHGKGNT